MLAPGIPSPGLYAPSSNSPHLNISGIKKREIESSNYFADNHVSTGRAPTPASFVLLAPPSIQRQWPTLASPPSFFWLNPLPKMPKLRLAGHKQPLFILKHSRSVSSLSGLLFDGVKWWASVQLIAVIFEKQPFIGDFVENFQQNAQHKVI